MRQFPVVALLIVSTLLAAGPAAPQSITDLAKKAAADKEKKEKEKAAADAAAKSTDPKSTDTKTTDTKTAAPAKKTFTDKDLATDPHDQAPVPPPTSTETATAAVTAPKSSSEAVTQDSLPRDRQTEAYWKSVLTPLWTKLDTDTLALGEAARRRDGYERAMHATEHSGPDGNIYVDRLAKQKYLDAVDEAGRWSAIVKADQVAIANIEEDGRRANVPPGWLRRR